MTYRIADSLIAGAGDATILTVWARGSARSMMKLLGWRDRKEGACGRSDGGTRTRTTGRIEGAFLRTGIIQALSLRALWHCCERLDEQPMDGR